MMTMTNTRSNKKPIQNPPNEKTIDQRWQDYQRRIGFYKKTVAKYNAIVKRIEELYKSTEHLDENNPDDVLKKAEIYGMILEDVGDLHYISITAWKYADALKKESYALAIIRERPSGRTVEAHREMAVLESQEWRWKMAEWEGLTKRWENAKTTIEEQIKIMKWKVKWELANMQQAGMTNPNA